MGGKPRVSPRIPLAASPSALGEGVTRGKGTGLGKFRTLSHWPLRQGTSWPSLCPLTPLSPLSLWTVPGMCPLTKHSSGVRREKASPGQGSWLVSWANPGGQSPRRRRLGIKQAIHLARSWHPQQGAGSLPGLAGALPGVGSLYADVLVEGPTVWAGATASS